MVKNKVALFGSVVLLVICMYLYFPFPNNVMLDARSTFMSFPIRNHDGYIWGGIIGSILFVIAMILLFIGMKKYHFRAIVIVIIFYAALPSFLIMLYQETLADGIEAIAYDGNGKCDFEFVSEDLLNGECELVLRNRSNKDVTFELEFLDSTFYREDEVRMESLMNVAGPFLITIEANQKRPIHFKELLDLSDVPKHIQGSGESLYVNIKLSDGETTRTL